MMHLPTKRDGLFLELVHYYLSNKVLSINFYKITRVKLLETKQRRNPFIIKFYTFCFLFSFFSYCKQRIKPYSIVFLRISLSKERNQCSIVISSH